MNQILLDMALSPSKLPLRDVPIFLFIFVFLTSIIAFYMIFHGSHRSDHTNDSKPIKKSKERPE